MLNELEQHFEQFNLSDTGSTHSHSTTSNNYATVRRHQRQHSKEAPNDRDKGFTEAELGYLGFVVDELFNLVIRNALDDHNGVQYRNTFAWKYQVLSSPSLTILMIERDLK
jgi:hypothetical protein